MNRIVSGMGVLAVGVLAAACAGWDNPTALADLDPVADFELEVSEVETMHEVALNIRVREGGAPLRLRQAQLEVQPPTGPARVIALEEHEGRHEAHVRFYEPGEHHLHLHGQPEKHHLMRELGEHEVHVERQHQLLGDHRFELAVSPAPILEGVPAHVTLHAWEMEHDGTIGHEAEGLHLHASLHMPDGTEIDLDFSEVEHGEYEAESHFPFAGSYGLHIEIEAEAGHGEEEAGHGDEEGHGDEHDAGHSEGVEFEIYVPSLAGDDVPADTGGGHGHGH